MEAHPYEWQTQRFNSVFQYCRSSHAGETTSRAIEITSHNKQYQQKYSRTTLKNRIFTGKRSTAALQHITAPTKTATIITRHMRPVVLAFEPFSKYQQTAQRIRQTKFLTATHHRPPINYPTTCHTKTRNPEINAGRRNLPRHVKNTSPPH